MRLIDLTCPNCGAAFQVDGDREYCFCQHCGTKMLIDNGTTRIIDEARIKEAEVQAQIAQIQAQLAQAQANLELQKSAQASKAEIITMLTIAFVLVFVIILSTLIY